MVTAPRHFKSFVLIVSIFRSGNLGTQAVHVTIRKGKNIICARKQNVRTGKETSGDKYINKPVLKTQNQ